MVRLADEDRTSHQVRQGPGADASRSVEPSFQVHPVPSPRIKAGTVSDQAYAINRCTSADSLE